jgi:hypothetical protein
MISLLKRGIYNKIMLISVKIKCKYNQCILKYLNLILLKAINVHILLIMNNI